MVRILGDGYGLNPEDDFGAMKVKGLGAVILVFYRHLLTPVLDGIR